MLYGVMFRENRVRKLHAFGCAASSITFSPTRRGELYVGLHDGRACVYDIVFEKLVATLRTHKHEVHSINVNDEWLMTSAVDGAALYETDTFVRKHSLAGGAGIVATHLTPLFVYKSTPEEDPVVFRPRIVCAFRDGHIAVWDGKDFSRIAQLHVPLDEGDVMFSSVSTSPEGSYLIAGTTSNTLFVWRVDDERLLRILDFTESSSKIVKVQSLHLEPVTDPKHITCSVLGDDGRLLILQVSTTDSETEEGDENVCRAIGEISVPAAAITNFEFGRHPVTQQPGAKKLQSMSMFSVECTSDGHLTAHDVKAALRIAKKRREAYERQQVATDGRQFAASQKTMDFARTSVATTNVQKVTSVPQTSTAGTMNTTQRETEEQGLASNEEHGVDTDSKGSEADRAVEQAWKQDTEYRNIEASDVVDSAFPRRYKNASEQADSSKRDAERLEWYDENENATEGSSGAVNSETLKGESLQYLLFKLRVLLRMKGAFPGDRRNTAWSALMRLPGNRHAYEALKAKGTHPKVEGILRDYALRSHRLSQKLEHVLSAVTWWLPGLCELQCLPSLAFPFIMQFGSDLHMATEFLMSFFLNFGSHWLESVPLPPLPLLSHVDVLLEHHDANLAVHLGKLGLSSIDYAWPLLRSAFSEVLNRQEWATLWDHLIAYSADSSLILLCVVAYLMYNRHSLMSIKPQRSPYGDGNDLDTGVEKAKVESFLRQQNPVQIGTLVKKLFKLRRSTPRYMLQAIPAATSRGGEASSQSSWPGLGPEPIGYYYRTVHEPERAEFVHLTPKDSQQLNIGRSSDMFQHPQFGVSLPYPNPELCGPLAVLPRKEVSLTYSVPSSGGGPLSHAHPKVNDAAINYQKAERDRITEEEKLLNERKAVIDELERQRKEGEHHRKLAEREQELLSTAEKNRLRWEKKRDNTWAAAKSESDATLRDARLRTIAQKDKDTSNFIQNQRKQKEEGQKLHQETSEQIRNDIHEKAASQLEQEALENLDSEADLRRLRALRESQQENATFTNQRNTQYRQKAAELETKLIGEAWRTEDEERRLKRRVRAEEVEKETHEEETRRQQRAKDAEQLMDQLEREATLSEAARERRLRHAAEEEQDRMDSRRQWVQRHQDSLQHAETAGMRRILEAEKEARRTAAAHAEKVQEESNRDHWNQFDHHRTRMADIESYENVGAYAEAAHASARMDTSRAQHEVNQTTSNKLGAQQEQERDTRIETDVATDAANRRRWAAAKSRLRSGLSSKDDEESGQTKPATSSGPKISSPPSPPTAPRRPNRPGSGSNLGKHKPLSSGPGGLGIGRVVGGKKVGSPDGEAAWTAVSQSQRQSPQEPVRPSSEQDSYSDFLEHESTDMDTEDTFSTESDQRTQTLADLEVRVGPASRVREYSSSQWGMSTRGYEASQSRSATVTTTSAAAPKETDSDDLGSSNTESTLSEDSDTGMRTHPRSQQESAGYKVTYNDYRESASTPSLSDSDK
eukprot:gb/GECG01012200.1/.p1 GENE.gb/GECG01012200.1/~~gb/GECG01012200.1/.p1  ORF type:complete len:1480 (+),score=223.93 gb/GECG01012200.1/:1-4440(+)